MFVPTPVLGNQYASVAIPYMLQADGKDKALGVLNESDALLLDMMQMAVSYAQELYANTSVVKEIETYLTSLYAPHLQDINNVTLVIDGEPVTIDNEQLIYIQ
jgi:hypothetical protein